LSLRARIFARVREFSDKDRRDANGLRAEIEAAQEMAPK
jgi:hypothetical protein